MASHDPTEPTIERHPLLSRRALLAAGGAGALLVIPGAIALGHDDDDDDDDDNSGPGNAEDRDDDHHHDDDYDDDDDDDEGDVPPEGTVPAGSAEVRIVDDDEDGFQPGTITVDAGQQVTFVNLDDEAHTATGANFDTGIMQPGQLVTITVDEPGSYPYSCQIHPVMTGQLEVRDAEGRVPASPEAATPAATPAAGADAEVTIVNFDFEPAEIEVAAGTTVTWMNEDQVSHTATSDEGVFDTGTLSQGESGSYTFDTAGRYGYFCEIHPSMTGTVIVI